MNEDREASRRQRRRAERETSRRRRAHAEALARWRLDEAELRTMLDNARTPWAIPHDRVIAPVPLRRDEVVLWQAARCGLAEAVSATPVLDTGYGGFSLRTVRPADSAPPRVADEGAAIVTDQRVVFRGSRTSREWDLHRLTRFAHDLTGPTTLIRVADRSGTSGLVPYGPDVAGFRFAFTLAVSMSAGRRAGFTAHLESLLATHRTLAPAAPAATATAATAARVASAALDTPATPSAWVAPAAPTGPNARIDSVAPIAPTGPDARVAPMASVTPDALDAPTTSGAPVTAGAPPPALPDVVRHGFWRTVYTGRPSMPVWLRATQGTAAATLTILLAAAAIGAFLPASPATPPAQAAPTAPAVAVVPTETATPTPTTPTPRPARTARPSPKPPPAPAPTPTADKTRSPAPSPEPRDLCGAPENPYGYNLCGGRLILDPASGTCRYFNCTDDFHRSRGFMIQCGDGTYSRYDGGDRYGGGRHDRDRRGGCSHHDGFRRPVFQ